VAKKTLPRKNEVHKLVASEILHRYANQTGETIALPIAIEMIVEKTYGLTIEWDDIDEPNGFVVLGALAPSTRTIVMNTRHLDRFERWVGPERFTLAHELAHWIYDADPMQQSLDLGGTAEVFCRRDDTSELDDTTRIREQNANKLAAHLLLPDELVVAADLEMVLADFQGTASAWGVSQQTLRIKLEGLGVLDDDDIDRLGPLFG
jgi:Zn-dependent peptidase ImmA (M78 family)